MDVKPTVISMITDFGYRDGYPGIVKGVIASIAPQAAVIDITHDIEPFNIKAAAFILHNSFRYFPQGSVHLVVVDPGVGSRQRKIVVRSACAAFVGPDNGLLSLVLPQLQQCEAFELTNRDFFLRPLSRTFHGRDIYGPCAAHLAKGVKAEQLGQQIDVASLVQFNRPAASAGGSLLGEIIYIDHFGNLITNIPVELLNDKSQICWLDKTRIGLADAYCAVGQGQPAAIAGSHGFLEIAVFKGRADQQLKAAVGQPVRLEQR